MISTLFDPVRLFINDMMMSKKLIFLLNVNALFITHLDCLKTQVKPRGNPEVKSRMSPPYPQRVVKGD